MNEQDYLSRVRDFLSSLPADPESREAYLDTLQNMIDMTRAFTRAFSQNDIDSD